MSEQEVKIRISTDATGATQAFDSLGRKMRQTESETATLAGKIKTHWLGISAAVAGAGYLANKGWNMAEAAAKFEQSRRAFASMASSIGEDADRLYTTLREKSAGLIDDKSLTESANRAMSLGIPIQKLGELMEISRVKARDMGITTAQAFNDIATGIGRASPMILDNLGLVMKVGPANEAMARTLGKTAEHLNDKEKKMAIINATISAGKEALERYNTTTLTTSEKMQKLSATVTNLKLVFGQGLIRAAAGASGALQWLAAGAMSLVSYLPRMVEYMSLASAKIYEWTGQTARMEAMRKEAQSWAKLADDMQGAASELTGQSADNFSAMIASTKDLATASARNIQPINETVVELDNKSEALLKSWREMEQTLSTRIESQGLDELSQALLKNQAEADKLKDRFKDLPAAIRKTAYQLVDQAQLADDTDAILRAEEKALAASEKAQAERERMIREAAETQSRNLDVQLSFYESLNINGQEYYDLQMQNLQRYAEAFREAKIAEADIEQWLFDKKLEFEEKLATSRLQNIQDGLYNISSMFESLSSLYDEDSKERKKLHDASIAFSLAEKAALTAETIVAAVKAIATQGSGDPYSAFVRVAAMAASMAGLLASAGILFNPQADAGGGQSPAMGNSTLLGAAYGTGSESVLNTLEMLDRTYTMTDTRLSRIHDELKSLNTNISGLVANLIRTNSIPGASDFGIDTNTVAPAWQELWGIGGSHLPSTIAGMGGDMLFAVSHELFNLLGKGMLAENISRVLNDIVGGGQEVSQGASGVWLGGGRLSDVIGGGGMDAKSYMDIVRRTSTEFWRGDSFDYETHYKELDTSVSRMFDLVYTSLGKTLVELAGQFGTDTQAAMNYIFEETKINLKDMTGEEINRALQEHISAVGDTAAESLFGQIIGQYQKLNEGMLETAVRLVSEKNIVQSILEMTGRAFTGTISQAIKFSQTLVEIAGGMDKLTSSFETYYQAFYTDEQKQNLLRRQLSGAMSELGYALPGDRVGYKNLVESIDPELQTAAYVRMIDLAEIADEYYRYLEKSRASIRESDYATRAEYNRAVRGFASGGYHPGGYRIVGESGPELEYTGPSSIQSTQDSRRALGTDELVAEVRRLRADANENNRQMNTYARQVSRLLDQWEGIGITVRT
ncbi:hypothetical protein M0R72_14025 [Candidatus Pacearchaeota archaeon]|jgi:hypothetical protein|nr:hypothetical protein [Candidatus Pacearchaeota archaeon]